MALSALLRRIAGGDGIRSSVMKDGAVRSVFRRVDQQTSFSSGFLRVNLRLHIKKNDLGHQLSPGLKERAHLAAGHR